MYCNSMGMALDCTVQGEVTPSVNPLVYNVKFTFGEPLNGSRMLLVWNLLQKWATANDCQMQGRVEREGKSLTTLIGIKRRFGEPQETHPVDKELEHARRRS